MNRSGVSWLLLMFMFGGLMFLMIYEDRHLSNSLADRRLHLARALRQANMPKEQASVLVEAIDGVGQDTRGILTAQFPLMAILLAMACADVYDLQRRLKKLESRTQQSSPAFQADAESP